MSSVLFIRPLCASGDPEFAEPLGLERITGYLREHDVCDVRVFDRRLAAAERAAGRAHAAAPGFYDEVRAAFPEGAAPDYVGLSLMTADDVVDARRIVSRLSAWWPSARFVAGGVFVTTSYQQARRMLPAQVVLLRGEGELPWHALLAGRAVPSSVQILRPDAWARAQRTELERYAALGCAVNLQTSRGCTGACTFCATPQLPAELRRWQARSVPLVADEVQHEAERLSRAGLPGVFNFVDDDFGPLERLEELAAELAQRQLRVAFACEMRFAALAGAEQLASRLKRLHEAGLTRVFVGIESLSYETLLRWRKPLELEALPQVIGAFTRSGVSLQPGYILWHGTQSVQGAREELQQLRELGIYNHRMALSRLIAFAGCALADAVDADGFAALSAEAAQSYARFAAASTELTRVWTQAALAEPYETARAFLTGEQGRAEELHRTLCEVNERSFELFMELSA